MNVFDVPLTVLHPNIPLSDFSKTTYFAHEQAGKQYTSFYQDISKKKPVIITYDELRTKNHVLMCIISLYYNLKNHIWRT